MMIGLKTTIPIKTTRIGYALCVALASAITAPVPGGPRGPNFQQGSMTSHTETESTVTETINSIDYRTGWEYSVSPWNIQQRRTSKPQREYINGDNTTLSVINGNERNSNDRSSNKFLRCIRPWSRSKLHNNYSGEAFSFVQTYQGPGMTNQTVIQRTTQIKSVTDTTSTFTQ